MQCNYLDKLNRSVNIKTAQNTVHGVCLEVIGFDPLQVDGIGMWVLDVVEKGRWLCGIWLSVNADESVKGRVGLIDLLLSFVWLQWVSIWNPSNSNNSLLRLIVANGAARDRSVCMNGECFWLLMDLNRLIRLKSSRLFIIIEWYGIGLNGRGNIGEWGLLKVVFGKIFLVDDWGWNCLDDRSCCSCVFLFGRFLFFVYKMPFDKSRRFLF